MNIWIFNHYATAPNHVGGTRHYDLARQLIKQGHEVTIFASSFNHLLRKEMISYNGENFKEEYIDGVRYIWIKTPKYGGAILRVKNIISYTIKSYFKAVKEIKSSKPDIIIGSSVHPLAAIVAYIISRRTQSKFYFEERDLWPQTFVDFGKLSVNNPIVRLLYKLESFLYQKADRIIVLFDRAVNYVESKNIEKDKIIYLPNGVDLERYKNIKTSNHIDEIYSQLKGKFILIYAGSHGIANHLEPIIEVASLLQSSEKYKDIHILMVGNGPLKKDLIKKSRSLNLTNITFIDPVTKEEIPYLLSRADLSFISIKDSPLYKWGFSMNKLYDYMAAGLPIMMLANNDIVGDLKNSGGLLISENPSQLVENIYSLYMNREKKLEMGKALKKYVEENYSWEILGRKLGNYINEDVRE